MKNEFLERLRSIPGHETDDISADDYARVEYVYTFHPSIPNVGGKDTIAYLYAFGGMLVVNDMYPRQSRPTRPSNGSGPSVLTSKAWRRPSKI